MRALIHELPYERPIAAGRYEYRRDGQPTGVLESWRLSAAAEGYQFLRVDVNDAGATVSGANGLYHLTLDARRRPQRLKFHLFGGSLSLRGDLIFDDGMALLSRTIADKRIESQTPHTPGAPFWFPTAAGLSMLAAQPLPTPVPALTLDKAADYALLPTTLAVKEGAQQTLSMMGHNIEAHLLHASWDGGECTLWLDDNGWPVQVQWPECSAHEQRYVRYGKDANDIATNLKVRNDTRHDV